MNSSSDIIQRQARDWLVVLTSGTVTKSTVADWADWCAQSAQHKAAFEEAKRLRHVLLSAAREYVAENRALAPSTAAPRLSSYRGLPRRAFLAGACAAAASVAALAVVKPPLGMWPSLEEWSADYRTEVGERRQVALASGVEVELNTKTSISVRSVSGNEVELIAGELSVSATGGPAFSVDVRNGRASATDARFDVRATGPAVYVTCEDGAVSVRCRGQTVSLLSQQQIAYSDQGLGRIVMVDPAEVTAWRQGMLIFHDEALAQVVEEVNRYRSGRIILTNNRLGALSVNGVFHIDRLDGVIAQVRSLGARVVRLPGNVVLLS